MNKKILLIVVLFISTITTLTVKAENLTNCIKTLDGECFNASSIDKQATNLNNTIADVGNFNNRPKLDCRNRHGFGYVMDSFYLTRNKFWVLDIIPNSSAQKAGLQVGDEILKVNGNKVNKMNDNMFDNAISPNNITLEVRNNSGKRNISMSRTNICVPIKDDNDELFNTYWKQIYAGENVEDINLYIQYVSRIYYNLSSGYKRYLQNYQNHVSYWQPKKIKFQNGYNSCKTHYTTDSETHACLSNLVNRELAQIQHEENIRQQQEILRAQQQMHQQTIYALYDYSNALRNQHVDVSGNIGVQHSGTVNVNQNVYGTMYHYNRW